MLDGMHQLLPGQQDGAVIDHHRGAAAHQHAKLGDDAAVYGGIALEKEFLDVSV